MKKLHIYDHRIINNYIKIFYIDKKNPGVIFWLKNGIIVINLIKKLIRYILNDNNYQEIQTPYLINQKNWKISGHLKNYKKYIFKIKKNNIKYCLKPMNCLGHITLYMKYKPSYKKLPIKYSEFGLCHRNEPTGSLLGLMRTKSFTQDDAHIFCTKKQIQKEILNCLNITLKIYKIFKFKKIYIYISTRPKKYLGDKKKWNKIEKTIIKLFYYNKIKFLIKKKQGAFYGPKIEFILKDKLKRKWQCGTIQIDFNLPKKFNLKYINKYNNFKTPFIIHRAILGSLERFIAILIEHNKGWLPIWLTPIQIIILNISNKNILYCKKILNIFKKYNYIRISSDFTNKKINYKIKKYTLQKVPYIIICGNKEQLINKINIRFTKKKIIKQKNITYLIKKIKYKYFKIFKGEYNY